MRNYEISNFIHSNKVNYPYLYNCGMYFDVEIGINKSQISRIFEFFEKNFEESLQHFI